MTIVIDKELMAEIDAYADKTKSKLSRSALLSRFIALGFEQTRTTKQLFSNRFIAESLRLIFGDGVMSWPGVGKLEAAPLTPASKAVRRNIINQIKQLSVAQAEAEIARDLGLRESAPGLQLPRVKRPDLLPPRSERK